MARLRVGQFLISLILVFAIYAPLNSQTKPKLTLDDFFNWVEIKDVKLSPDGNSVLIATERADWEQQIFRDELWLYRISGGSGTESSGTDDPEALVQLTQSGRDKDAAMVAGWEVDRVSFGDEKAQGASVASVRETMKTTMMTRGKKDAQIYLISPSGGEAFAVTSGSEEVHAFGWGADSKAIYFATREPWSKQQTDDHKKDWKDVVRYRGDERGDVIFRIGLDDALARHAALGSREVPDAEKDSSSTPGATAVARTALRIDQLCISPDGHRLAFLSNSVSQRQEAADEVEIYLVNLTGGAARSRPDATDSQRGGRTESGVGDGQPASLLSGQPGIGREEIRGCGASALLGGCR